MAELTISAPQDGVALVELNRPPANLWSIELCRRFIAALERPAAGAHILRLRSGGDVFCLGRDREGSSPDELRAEAEVLVGLHRALRNTSLVTVAEVQGDAAGFGVGILACCDVTVATADAGFSFPEVTIDLAPSVVLTWLARVVGERQAFWLTATGERITAARALELGLLNAVVPSTEALRTDVDERIALLRTHKPRVHSEIRDMLRVMGAVDTDRALDISVDRLVVGSLRRSSGAQ